MIELRSRHVPHGQQVHILLEETGLPYTLMPAAMEEPAPAILDHQAQGGPMRLLEAGAILIYLAEKAGNFIPLEPAGRYLSLQWLMFQAAFLGPALSQPQAQELTPLFAVLNQRLTEDDFLAGTYSIADMAA